jgi:hypothetical protein
LRVRGFIDGVVDGHVFGWVLDEDEPRRRLSVLATLDGVTLPRVDASEPRNDLRLAGIGDGSSGFRIPLSERLASGGHELEVIVEDAGETLPLADDWVVLDNHGRAIDGVELRPRGTEAPSDPVPQAFTSSPLPADDDRSVIGDAGWLFALPRTDLGRLLGVQHPAHAELDAAAEYLERVHHDALAVGAIPLVACVPDKAHVYSDRLPPGLATVPRQRLSRLVIGHLRDSDGTDLVDLLEPLLDARAHGRIFTRTGHGLTWVGAFHGYRAIARVLSVRVPGLAPLPSTELDLGPLVPIEDSLEHTPRYVWTGGRMLPAQLSGAPSPPDREPELGDRTPLRAIDAGRDNEGQLWARPDRPELSSALIVTTPAGRRIARLLAEHFSRSMIVYASAVDPHQLRARRPDALIQITSDRALLQARR